MTPLAGRHSRRAFLTATATVVASAVLFGPGRAGPPGALAGTAARSPALSLGFVEGATTLAEAAGRRAVPAAGLAGGDGTLVGTLVRVTVLGLVPRAAAPAQDPRYLHLDALLVPRGRWHGEPLTFHAWSLRRDAGSLGRAGGAWSSGRVTFTWDVGAEPSLAFRLAAGRDAAGGGPGDQEQPAVAVLTAGSERGTPKLRRGLYLLSAGGRQWDEPATVPAPGDARAWAARPAVAVAVTGTG